MKAFHAGALIFTYAVFATLLSLASTKPHTPIELSVTPHYCLAPCDVRAIVRVDPHPLNRWFILQLDGEMFQGEQRELHGEQSAATQEPIWFKALPAGEYRIVAVVYRQQLQSEAGRVTDAVTVVGP